MPWVCHAAGARLLRDSFLRVLAQLDVAVDLGEAASERRRLLLSEQPDHLRRLESLGDRSAHGEPGRFELGLQREVAAGHLGERLLEFVELGARVLCRRARTVDSCARGSGAGGAHLSFSLVLVGGHLIAEGL